VLGVFIPEGGFLGDGVMLSDKMKQAINKLLSILSIQETADFFFGFLHDSLSLSTPKKTYSI
jgi:hypothetical protein